MNIYKIANLYIEIEPKSEFTKEYLKDYLVDETMPDFSVKVSQEMIEYERILSSATNSDQFCELMAILRVICDEMIRFNGFFLHCSCLEYKGYAYVFAGESGAGKSTHARLWRERFKKEVTMINDDKPLVRLHGEQFYIYGTPYNGKHNISNNISAPIKAIFLIEQGNENKIEKIDNVRATTLMLHQTVIPEDKEKMEKLLTLFDKLISSVPFYKLICTISEDAVDAASSVIL